MRCPLAHLLAKVDQQMQLAEKGAGLLRVQSIHIEQIEDSLEHSIFCPA